MKTYECPHCGADDSTRCAVLPDQPVRGYSAAQIARGRAVGCRRSFYADLHEREKRGGPFFTADPITVTKSR